MPRAAATPALLQLLGSCECCLGWLARWSWEASAHHFQIMSKSLFISRHLKKTREQREAFPPTFLPNTFSTMKYDERNKGIRVD
jgi:hypothetical protein